MTRPVSWLAVAALAALIATGGALGCGDDSTSAPMDAGAMDAPAADAAPADGSVPDAGPIDAGRTCPPIGPTAPATDPTPVPVDRWLVASAGDGSTVDPVEQALESGTFAMPSAGTDMNGIDWYAFTPTDTGAIETGLRGAVYAVATIDVPEGQRVFARADRVFRIWVNGALSPGDVYGSHELRIPLAVHPGTNVIVAELAGGRGYPELELWTTPDEVVFNPDDVTEPDLRVGEMADQWLGVPVLNTTGWAALGVKAMVLDSADFEATEQTYASLAPDAVTELAFHLVPKAPWSAPDTMVPVHLRIEACVFGASYETTVQVPTIAADAPYRRTFRSPMDGSAQYFGVRPPSSFDPSRDYGLVLSLHGAGVQAINQARSYSPKDWTYVVAPTNRRPFGFDWEEWGRLDGLEVLDEAMRIFHIDPTRVYVTGHSMGGHGTWQFGVLFPGRFATAGPSSGWASFYSYGGATRPTYPISRARASSDTVQYISNLARRGVYILHATGDPVVPVSEARTMNMLVSMVTSDLVYDEEPYDAHWWDGDASPGVDCVDWPPLFDFMQAHTLDPTELTFDFTTPGPWVSPTDSYVTIESVTTPMEDAALSSASTSATEVTLTTTNVRSMRLDGSALMAKGVDTIVVDGTSMPVTDGPMQIGPSDGKTLEVSGPLNQVFQHPFCFVYPDDGPDAYRDYASYLISTWDLLGNGQACALPLSELTDAIAADHDLVYVGVPEDVLAARATVPVSWDASGITVGAWHVDHGAGAFVFPEGDRLSAAFVATPGDERLLYRYQPFSSRAGLPDYFVWTDGGGAIAGFLDAQFHVDPSLGVGP